MNDLNGFIKLENDYWGIDLENGYFIFHSLGGEPFIVEKNDIDGDLSEVNFEGIDYSENVRKEIIEKTDKYIDEYFGPTGIDLSVSEVCNLGCPMCFHNIAINNNDNRNVIKYMQFERAKEWIDFYVEYAENHNISPLTFHIGSAEPFINKDNLWKIIDYIHNKGEEKPIDIFLNSNLTLIDEDDADRIKKYGVHVFVGVDGLQEANDSTRVYKVNGRGTFGDIIKNIKMLIQKGVEIGVNITLTNDNFEKVNPKETVDYFAKLGVKSILIDTDVVTHIKYNAKDIVDKLMDFNINCDIINMICYGSWKIPFNMLTAENSNEEPKSFCAARTGKNIVVTPSKGITFCTYSSQIMIPNSTSPKESFNYFTEIMKERMNSTLPGKVQNCAGCPLEGFCMGGCLLAHENHGLDNNMCDIYLEATKRLIRHYYTNYSE